MPLATRFSHRDIQQLFNDNATPVRGRTIEFKSIAAASGELIHQGLKTTFFRSKYVRTHLSHMSMVSGNDDVPIEDRLPDHLVNLIGSLSTSSHNCFYCATFLFEVDSGFGGSISATALLYFRHAVFWFDVVAACFAVDAAFGGFWRRHRGVHGDFSLFFDDPFDF